MYKIDETINSEGSGINFLDVGIHENVELVNIKYQKNESGSEFCVFNFEKDGLKLNHTEWKPRDNDLTKLEEKEANQIKRFKHIATKFISDSKFVFEAVDFKEMCEKTIAALGDSYKNKKVRIKVVYNNNNYTTLPKYTPFIESMDTPIEESKLKVISIDKMKKTTADIEKSVVNPFESSDGKAATKTDDDLPF